VDKDLPDLYTGHTDGDAEKGRKPFLMKAYEAVSEGSSKNIGDTEFKLNLKRAAILTHVGDAVVEMAINRNMEARAKARMPLLGGDVEVEANRDSDGRHRFSAKSRTPVFGGNLEVGADRNEDGNNSVNLRFSKQFSSSKP
jgi:hypothetical protein